MNVIICYCMCVFSTWIGNGLTRICLGETNWCFSLKNENCKLLETASTKYRLTLTNYHSFLTTKILVYVYTPVMKWRFKYILKTKFLKLQVPYSVWGISLVDINQKVFLFSLILNCWIGQHSLCTKTSWADLFSLEFDEQNITLMFKSSRDFHLNFKVYNNAYFTINLFIINHS